MIRLELATAEYIGARTQQQDQAAAVPLPVGAVLILADGLGGHESGAEAARIVVETFREAGAGGRFNNPQTRRQALWEALERANSRIGDGVDPSHGSRGMASTAVAAVVTHGELSWVSVGDSHLYVWRDGRLTKLNEDHSQAGLMVRSGKYRPDDPEVRAVRSVLVSALTGRKLEIVDLPNRTYKIEPGDVLMLASDGLNTLEDDEIEDIVTEARTQGAARLSSTLLERVRSRRLERQDNTTVAIARVLGAPSQTDHETTEPQARPLPSDTATTELADAPRQPPADVRSPSLELAEARTERIEPLATPIEEPLPDVAPSAAAPPTDAGLKEREATPAAAGQLSTPEARRAPATDEPSPPPAALGQPASPGGDSPPAEREVVGAPPPSPRAAIEPGQPIPAGAGRPTSGPAPAEAARPPVATLGRPDRPSAPETARPLIERSRPSLPSLSEPPPAPRSATTQQQRGSSLGRALLMILLLSVIAGGVTVAAIAVYNPDWFNSLLAGIGTTQDRTGAKGGQLSRPPEEAVPPPRPAAPPSADPAQTTPVPNPAANAGTGRSETAADRDSGTVPPPAQPAPAQPPPAQPPPAQPSSGQPPTVQPALVEQLKQVKPPATDVNAPAKTGN
jgi:protein phosphatase